jgi:hypothetical protein
MYGNPVIRDYDQLDFYNGQQAHFTPQRQIQYRHHYVPCIIAVYTTTAVSPCRAVNRDQTRQFPYSDRAAHLFDPQTRAANQTREAPLSSYEPLTFREDCIFVLLT